jgi:hypothetical protein
MKPTSGNHEDGTIIQLLLLFPIYTFCSVVLFFLWIRAALMTFLSVAEEFVGNVRYYSVNGLYGTSSALSNILQNKRSSTLSGNIEFRYIEICR